MEIVCENEKRCKHNIIVDLARLRSRDEINLSPNCDDSFESKPNENGLSDRPIVEEGK